ncbi:MAG: DUF4380 domain-containing protein, partial [Bacteroidota bacterium]
MKKYDFYFLCLLITGALFGCQQQSEAKKTADAEILTITQLANSDFHFLLGENILEALIKPSDGGKLVSLKYKGKEVLASKAADSVAYGSTFWPSPHNWGWPPASEIDRDAYSSKLKENTLIMQGPVIQKMGLRFVKEFTLIPEDTSLYFRYTIINTSEEVKSVAPWEVTRVPKGGLAFFPVSENYKSFENLNSGIKEDLYFCEVPTGYNGKSQKINFDASEGWLAYLRENTLFVKQVDNLNAEQIAPNEGDVELYIDDLSDYIELENQGIYTKLQPGDSLHYDTKWFLN